MVPNECGFLVLLLDTRGGASIIYSKPIDKQTRGSGRVAVVPAPESEGRLAVSPRGKDDGENPPRVVFGTVCDALTGDAPSKKTRLAPLTATMRIIV